MPSMYSHPRLVVTFAALLCTVAPNLAAAASGIASSTEDRVRAYFWDLPVMSAIAKCESEFTQFNHLGEVLRGGYLGRMIGVYQIAPMHIPEATSLGIDVTTLEGNMAFARHLYDQSGTRPWAASEWCWHTLPEATAVVDRSTKIAMIQKQIDSIRAALAAFE